MLRRVSILLLAAAFGAGASLGVSACGEDRGSVSVEDGGTGTERTGTGKTKTGGTGTSGAPTTTSRTETETTETGP